ncbi:hypothetical protein [Mycolicibacterium phlei]
MPETKMPAWCATALTLAMLATAFTNGVGAFVGGLVLVGVIWSLVRLRDAAPAARSTSDLVGAVLGDRAATTVALLQGCAYVFVAANAAAALGLVVSVVSPGAGHPLDDPGGSWWPLWSVLAAIAAAALIYSASTRVVAAVCGVLAGAAVVIGVSLAVALLATMTGGATPVPVSAYPVGLTAVNTLLLAGLSVVGFEVVTTANDRLRSAARPMGAALAVAMVCAVVIWAAAGAATVGEPFDRVGHFGDAVEGYLGASGATWLKVMVVCVQAALLLAVLWGLRRIAGRIAPAVGMPSVLVVPAVSVGALAASLSWPALTPLAPSVAAVLLVVVYLFVAEAGARLPGRQDVAQAVRVVMLVVLAAVVLAPLLDVYASTGPVPHALTEADVLLRTLLGGLVVAGAAVVAKRWPGLVRADRRRVPRGQPVGKRGRPLP